LPSKENRSVKKKKKKKFNLLAGDSGVFEYKETERIYQLYFSV